MSLALIALAVAACGVAAKCSSDADDYNDEAEDINDRAESLLGGAARTLRNGRQGAVRAMKRLDEKKKAVMDEPLSRFAEAFGKLKNFSYKELSAMPTIPGARIGKVEFFEMQKLTTSATVGAFLLGGVAFAALAKRAKARENLENAHSNMAIAKSRAAKMRLASLGFKAIAERADLFVGLIACACEMFYPQLEALELAVRKHTDYAKMSVADQKAVCFAVTTVQLIKNLLEAPIASPQGQVDAKSTKIAKESIQRLELCHK